MNMEHMVGNIKMNTMEVFEHDTDKQLNVPPLFRLHVEITDVDFERLKTLPKITVDYKVRD